VLKALTVNGARVCGIENETGSIRKGKHADITIIDGNPVTDITALRKIKAVFTKGRIVTSGIFDSKDKDFITLK